MPSHPDDMVRFLLGHDAREVDMGKFAEPGLMTVLRYLRESEGLTGTKEGCAQGDCGACTVVMAEPVDGRLRYKAVNSCLMTLPMLHGRQLICVEHLEDHGTLHPIQQAIVEHHGSQCGFCTPGVVMSLFALWKEHSSFDERDARLALAGNLCRCTGYLPIMKAAMAIRDLRREDLFSRRESEALGVLDRLRAESPGLVIEIPGLSYIRKDSLESSLEALSAAPGSRVLGGGTDMLLSVTKRWQPLRQVVDLGAVASIRGVEEKDDAFVIGAGTSLEELRQRLGDSFPALSGLLERFGSTQIRNLATVAGNLASASPVGDLAPLLIAASARVRLNTREGSRELPVEDFITAYRQTALGQGELITTLVLPKPKPGLQISFEKLSRRREVDISTVSAGLSIGKDEQGRVSSVIIAFGGMADMPRRARHAEKELSGNHIDDEVIARAVEALGRDFDPISDARSSGEGRLLMARKLLRRLTRIT